METVYSAIDQLNGILWGPWTPWVLLAAGLLFTIWSRFTQYNAMTHGIAVVRGVYDDPDDPGAINHFQALSAALSATVGLGNIGGVALAISMGGPGALFWMWVTGVFGMALKTIEITLAMMYRNTDDPENPHGGAMWVVEKVIGGKGGFWQPVARGIGLFFCITLIISTMTGGNMFQAWNVADLTLVNFGVPRLVTGVVMAIIVGLVIIGGIKRIGAVTGKLVPVMCILYVVSALAVLAGNVAEIPGLLSLVVQSAFSPTEAGGAFLGGTMGFAFMQGMQRALFSNEAGQGSAPIAHSAAKTDEPAREGIVGGIGPFIDTLCICTITALVILTTGTWNREPIGDLDGTVRLTRIGEAEDKVFFEITAPSATSALPESRFATWGEGQIPYLLATVNGATGKDTGSSVIEIQGTIAGRVDPTAGAEAPVPLEIQWGSARAPESEGEASDGYRPPVGVRFLALERGEWQGSIDSVEVASLGVYRKYDGASLTAHAFDREFLGLGRYLVTIAAWLFALSTMISWSYYGEQGIVYMFRSQGAVFLYKLLFLALTIYAAAYVNDTAHMITLMDLGTGAMLWANIPIVLGLGYLAVRCLNEYIGRLRSGNMPRHAARTLTDLVHPEDGHEHQ